MDSGKKILAILVGMCAVLWLVFPASQQKTQPWPISSTNGPANTLYARPVDGNWADAWFVPFPERTNKVIIHHGGGWFYFPFADESERLDAKLAFERKFPNLEHLGRLKEEFSVYGARYTGKLPLFPEPYTGEFRKYRPRLAKDMVAETTEVDTNDYNF